MTALDSLLDPEHEEGEQHEEALREAAFQLGREADQEEQEHKAREVIRKAS